jgi:hypothetical protein
MPNAIKYNTSAETLALKKGNFWIGTGDVGKGPTSSTGFYNGITPPSGGYTIYLNKASGGPSIYTVNTEAQMVSLTNSIGSQSFTTSGQCLNWFATQTDKMIFNIDYPAIVTDGLVLNVDAGFTPSYPTTATTWYDVSSSGNNGTLTNGPTFNSANGGSIVFDGVDDYVNFGNILNPSLLNNNFTIEIWFNSSAYRFGQQQRLVSYHDWYAFFFDSNSILRFEIRLNDFSYRAVTTTIPSVDSWNQLVATCNGTKLEIYKNGVLSNSANYTGSIGTINYVFNIGAYQNDTQYRINGKMSSTKMYNRALTPSEVLQNYNAYKSRFGL